jgi:hypothetical protein
MSENDTQTIQTKLLLISKLQVWDKLYIGNGSTVIEPWSYWQPLTRMLWNLRYGGANRRKLVWFLEDVYICVEKKVMCSMAILNKPYVNKNWNIYGTMSEENGNCLKLLKELAQLLSLCVLGLEQLQKTYASDENTFEKIKEITVKYGKLSISTMNYIQRSNLL